MLASDIKSGTVGYKNKILVHDGTLSLGKNFMVNTLEKSSHKRSIVHAHKTSIVPKHAHKEVPSKRTSAITHEEEKIALILVLTSALVHFSIMRGARQSNPIEVTTERRIFFSSKAHDR